MSSTTGRNSSQIRRTKRRSIPTVSTSTPRLLPPTSRWSSSSNGPSMRLRSMFFQRYRDALSSLGIGLLTAMLVLAELEACSFSGNKSPAETATHMKPLLDKYLHIEANSSSSSQLFAQRQKDHYSHFILRLAFSTDRGSPAAILPCRNHAVSHAIYG